MSFRKYWLPFGLLAGLIIIAPWFLTAWFGDSSAFMDTPNAELIGYSIMLVALAPMVLVGVKRYRDREHGGTISFGRAFGLGLGIVLIASVIYVLGWMLFYTNYMPDFADQYQEIRTTEIRANADLSPAEQEAEISEMEEMMSMYQNPLVMAGFTFTEIFPVGLLIALIAGAILRKKEHAPS